MSEQPNTDVMAHRIDKLRRANKILIDTLDDCRDLLERLNCNADTVQMMTKIDNAFDEAGRK